MSLNLISDMLQGMQILYLILIPCPCNRKFSQENHQKAVKPYLDSTENPIFGRSLPWRDCPGATAIHKGLPYVGQGFIPCFWSGPGMNTDCKDFKYKELIE